MRVGNILLERPFVQASLSGYSDKAMRAISRQFGAPMTFAGVMLAKSIARPGIVDKLKIRVENDEHPIGAQILGDNPEVMAKAAKLLSDAGFDLIDINFACPAPKVIRREIGGFLMTKPELVRQITRCVREAVSCPVTLKLRAGYDDSSASREDFWRICEEAVTDGIDAITLHGRTVVQRFTGRADWSLPAEVKRKFPKLVLFGSGDLFDAQTAISYLNAKTVDGIVIARGAIGNPWIFADLNALWEGKPKPPHPSIAEQGQTIRKHFEMVNEIYAPAKSIRYFRKFAAAYCKLHPKRKQTIQLLLSAGTKADFLAAVEDCYCTATR